MLEMMSLTPAPTVDAICEEIFGILPGVSTNTDYLVAVVTQYLPLHGRERTIEFALDHFLDGTFPDRLTSSAGSLSAQSEASEDFRCNQTSCGLEDQISQGLVECQCCFLDVADDRMIRCTDGGHPFCEACVQNQVGSQLYLLNTDIRCMDTSTPGCPSSFPVATLRHHLPAPLLSLYDNIVQRKEIKEANLEGLEECPFCDFACIIETPLEMMPVFHCGNLQICGAASCRICRTKSHPGRSCRDVEMITSCDRKRVEEEMTKALIRTCPWCTAPFVKEDGVSHCRISVRS